jgi:1,4-alpha-glucan branching enzyme
MRDARRSPMSIYEVHLGSWRKKNGTDFLSYDELATDLVSYVSDLGFTHIELLPISEHPYDPSWGYQPTGLFAPTSRFGDPEGFARFVNAAHMAGIGIILDWVPAHFPTDEFGLAHFDGTALYEHADPRKGFHPDWNTAIYNFGRTEVQSFLINNALFWLEKYHIDGLRVDAVASMLYLDYSRKSGEWIPNERGGNENLEAIAFLKRMNEVCYGTHPGIITIAEESTAFPGVSQPSYTGGLGFGFKWNMGFMHDTLQYMSRDPIHRRHHHNDLTFGLLYAFSENFVLPLSHDEVVHGKEFTAAEDGRRYPDQNLPGFAPTNAHVGLSRQETSVHGPGICALKMNGRGQKPGLALLGFEPHKVCKRIADLNKLYKSSPASAWQDCEGEGFQWLIADDHARIRCSPGRAGLAKASPIVSISNLTPVPRIGYVVPMPRAGRWIESQFRCLGYGGTGLGNGGSVLAIAKETAGQPAEAILTLPPMATLILEFSAT